MNQKNSTEESKTLRILSGITPSSSKGLHLGNYLGAIKPQMDFQEKGQCLYFIADYHALNTVFNPKEFSNNVYETYLDYLACGVDLESTTFFVESHVKEVFELTEILNNVVTLAQMKRMHAYKDKLQDENSEVDQINMGLFNYPILMAADILLYQPDVIPVGEDQSQHVEIARDMAKSFNHRYGKVLKIPKIYVRPGVARVPGTDGERKMSKSLGNDLTIFATESDLKKQIMGIKTDPARIKKDDPGDPDKNVIFTYLRLLEYPKDEIKEFEDRYRAGTIGDVELKNIFYEYFLDYFAIFRKSRAELQKDRAGILSLIEKNAISATEIASDTMSKVKKAIGAII